MLTARVPLSGVKTTSKSVAEKLELAMHGFKEFDSNMRMAEEKGRRKERAANSSHDGDMVDCSRMVRVGGGCCKLRESGGCCRWPGSGRREAERAGDSADGVVKVDERLW